MTELAERLLERAALPAYPRRVLELVELVESDAPLPRIAQAVAQDPAVASRVLKIANSAFYGLSRQVASLDLAVVLLGLRHLRHIVQGIGFLQLLTDQELAGPYPGPDLPAHSARVGRLTRLLARHHGHAFHGEEFLAGLIHDIGKLVLLRGFPEQFQERTDPLALHGAQLLPHERSRSGADHTQVGAWAAERWQLPALIVGAIRDHHDPAAIDPLPRLVAAADHAAHWFETPGATPAEWAAHPLLVGLDPRTVHAQIADPEA